MKLLLASGNPKKLAELRGLLAAAPELHGLRLLAPADLPRGLPEAVEDRDTFAGNAAKKAAEAARHTGLWCLADDSGLEVRHLGGRPGVRSARFAGEPCDDAANNALLLRELADVPDEQRGARFVCALALARPDGSLAVELRGTAHGRILHAPRGDGDFGYDPLFQFEEPDHAQTGRSFAELDSDEKSRVSHRGRALRELVRALPDLMRQAAERP